MDTEILDLIEKEKKRQKEVINLIPSENYVSEEVLRAIGSVLTNKYSEGYPKKRYYQGNKYIDEIETLAIERAKKLFDVPFANVQAYSGSIANLAVYFALLKPGDTLMGMSLPAGGHLTHGASVTISGINYKSVQYGVGKDGYIDYDEVEKLALKCKPKVIVCGATAYPRVIDFEKFGKIADLCGAFLLSDISHIAGLIVGGVHQSPVPFAHVIMTTTHKSLRGPRGAILMVTERGLEKDPNLAKKIDHAVFPGLQGGPHDNVTAGIAICLKEASESSFREYAKQVVINAKILAEELRSGGLILSTGGTDNHLILVDLRNRNLSGKVVAEALERTGIVVNKNTIPFDMGSSFDPSGIRLGTPAVTTKGMKQEEMKQIGGFIVSVINHLEKVSSRGDFENDKFFDIMANTINNFIHT